MSKIFNKISLIAINILFFGVAVAQMPAPVKLLCVIENGNEIEIDWELTGPPCGAGFEEFDIYVSNNPDTGFTRRGSVTDESITVYVDGTSLSEIGDPLYYAIVNRCNGVSSEQSEVLDNLPPVAPQIEYVTVNRDNTVEISWLPSTSPEAATYLPYIRTNAGFSPLDTAESLSYLHQAKPSDPGFIFPVPNIQPESYTVATIDNCGEGGVTNTLPHKTMHLKVETMDCSNTVFLNWNAYEGWGSTGIDHYELYSSVNGEAQEVINYNIEADAETYTFVNSERGVDEICFQIKAIRYGDSVTSASNDTCVSLATASSNLPSHLYIKNVSVLDNGSVELSYYADNSVYIEAIKYASGSSEDNISVFDSEFIGGNLPEIGSYTHITSETFNRILSYQIEVEDDCGFPYRSGIARTIYLQGKADGNKTNYLTWTGYGNFEATVNEYYIYRQNPDGSFTEIGMADPTNVQFSDDVENAESNENGQICYKVEAKITLRYDDFVPPERIVPLSSFSNIVCINQPARISVPNAFAPEGVNNVFKPLTLNIAPSFYNMIVFNRWGGVVFETDDPDAGWDGTYQGRIAQEGVYMYNFTYAGIDGDQKQKKGSVVLLR